MEELRALAKEGTVSHGIRTADADFTYQARRLFGSWEAAVHAAGLEHNRAETWTPARVIETIRLRADMDLPVHASRIEDDLKGCYQAGRRHFGSWDDALRAAGLKPESVRRSREWNRAAIREALRTLWKGRKKPMTTSALLALDQGLYVASLKYFGSIARAANSAGVHFVSQRPHASREQLVGSLGTAAERLRLPFASRVQHCSRERVIDVLKERCRGGKPLTPKVIMDEAPSLYYAIGRYFESYDEGLKAARIPVAQGRERRGWRAAEIEEQLRAWTRKSAYYERDPPAGPIVRATDYLASRTHTIGAGVLTP